MKDDRDDLFERLEETLEELGLDDRFDDLEERLEEVQEQQDSPFGNVDPFGDGGPFGGGPFGGDGPLSGDGGPFGDVEDQQQEQTHGLVSGVDETEDHVVVRVDLPEFTEDQVDITADVERVRVEAEATEDMYHESVSQVLELPTEVRPEGADATYANGFLTVELPRAEPDDQTTITIE